MLRTEIPDPRSSIQDSRCGIEPSRINARVMQVVGGVWVVRW
jgi:hypothetical protein